MDTNKLLQILELIEADEKEFSIANRINEIHSLISQNNKDSNTKAEEALGALEIDVQRSRAFQFVTTELTFLKQLDAESYFGSDLNNKLSRILNSRGYEVINKLNEFRESRATKYNKLIQLKNLLKETGISAYEQSGDDLVLSIPHEKNKVVDVADYLNKLQRLIGDIRACRPSDSYSIPEISFVSQGSLDFFIHTDPTTIEIIFHVMGDLATTYLAINEIRKKKIDHPLIPAEHRAQIEGIYEDVARQQKEKFIDETVQKICGEGTVEPETQSRLSQSLRFLFKWLPMGIHLEIAYKKSVEPVSPGTDVEPGSATRLEEKTRIAEMYKLPPANLNLPESTNEEE